MSYPPLPSNGQTNWGATFRAWADALEGRKVEGEGMTLRRSTNVGERVFLDYPGGTTMLYGDTGWRDITSLLIPDRLDTVTDLSNGMFAVRRIGATVHMNIRARIGPDLLGNPRDASWTLLENNMPNGFWQTPALYGFLGQTKTSVSQADVFFTNGSGQRFFVMRGYDGNWEERERLNVSIQWTTELAWPNALPGEPL